MKPKNKLRRVYLVIQIAYAFDGRLYSYPEDKIAFKPFTCLESDLPKHVPVIGSRWQGGIVVEYRIAYTSSPRASGR